MMATSKKNPKSFPTDEDPPEDLEQVAEMPPEEPPATPVEQPADLPSPLDPPAPEVPLEQQPDSPEVKALKADERQPAEKEPGPAPIDSATLQVAQLPGAESLETLKIPSEEELAKLDQVDPARAAGLRRQRDWVHDSKKIFKGDSREEIERKENILEMDKLDARERQRVKDEEAEKARLAKIATRDARILAIGNRLNEMEIEAQALIAEREDLYALKSE